MITDYMQHVTLYEPDWLWLHSCHRVAVDKIDPLHEDANSRVLLANIQVLPISAFLNTES